MSDLLVERHVVCPFCWQSIPLLFDLSAAGQTLIEDCQVCCNPMQISYRAAGGEVTDIEVEPANG